MLSGIIARVIRHRAVPAAMLAAILVASPFFSVPPVRADSIAMQGGFELTAEASQWFNDNQNVATGLLHMRLARDCTGWQHMFELDLTTVDINRTLQMAGTGVLVENIDGTEGAVQLAMNFASDREDLSGRSFSYAARYRRAGPFAAGHGKLNRVAASGEEQRAFDLPDGALTPVQSWWAMVDAVAGGATSFKQELTLFGFLGSTELGDLPRNKAFFSVIDSPFDSFELPRDPSGALTGRQWTVQIVIPSGETDFDGVRIAELQLFETGAVGYMLLKRPDTRILMRPTAVTLLPPPDC
jgi:hypothetical protein